MDDNQEPGTSSAGSGVPDRSREGLSPSSNNRPRTGGASKGAVPKWFKGTGKNVENFQFIGYMLTRRGRGYHIRLPCEALQTLICLFRTLFGQVLLVNMVVLPLRNHTGLPGRTYEIPRKNINEMTLGRT